MDARTVQRSVGRNTADKRGLESPVVAVGVDAAARDRITRSDSANSSCAKIEAR
jgi:hypothetical protein